MTPVLTKSGEHFVTAMSLGTLAEARSTARCGSSRTRSRSATSSSPRAADFVLVCPATADLLAKMAAGIADDFATTLLLATDKPVVVAPAMNVRMWRHAATARNIQQLIDDGVQVIEPAEGEMACGEFGPGRLPEPKRHHALARARPSLLGKRRSTGKHILVTAGPTHEPIDPVRVIANRSSGRQGFAIAAAAAEAAHGSRWSPAGRPGHAARRRPDRRRNRRTNGRRGIRRAPRRCRDPRRRRRRLEGRGRRRPS